MKNRTIIIERKESERKKILKAGVDLDSIYEVILLYKAKEAIVIILGIAGVGILLNKLAMQYNEMLINQIIIEGTQKFLNTILGLEAGVTREGFIYLDKSFLKYHRDLIDQERILEAIISKLEIYYNTQALHDVEGPKFNQVIVELKKKLQEVRELKDKITE